MFNYHQGWQQYKPGMFTPKSDAEVIKDIGILAVNKPDPKFHTISVNLTWRVEGGLTTRDEAALLKNFHDEHRIFQISEKLLDSYKASPDLVRLLAEKSIPDVMIHYDVIDDISVKIVHVSSCEDLTAGKSLGTYGTKPIIVDKPAKAIYQKFNNMKEKFKCQN